MLVVIAILVVLAILGPLIGADSRDGLDWTPGAFWLRRRSGPERKRPDRGPGTAGEPAAASPAPAAASAAPAAPAAAKRTEMAGCLAA